MISDLLNVRLMSLSSLFSSTMTIQDYIVSISGVDFAEEVKRMITAQQLQEAYQRILNDLEQMKMLREEAKVTLDLLTISHCDDEQETCEEILQELLMMMRRVKRGEKIDEGKLCSTLAGR